LRANASMANRFLFKKSRVENNHLVNTTEPMPETRRKNGMVGKRHAEENDGLLTRQHSPMSSPSHKRPSAWKQRFCDWKWKFLLFYSAPITSFWIWSMSFTVFMLAFIYVLLIEFPNHVTMLEWFIFFYVLAVGLEHFRKV